MRRFSTTTLHESLWPSRNFAATPTTATMQCLPPISLFDSFTSLRLLLISSPSFAPPFYLWPFSAPPSFPVRDPASNRDFAT
uniref:Uncharacterized protein n=1 Tax=Arundo donax TaxID=35708 RepID=A0A0A8Y6H4_ARUDO